MLSQVKKVEKGRYFKMSLKKPILSSYSTSTKNESVLRKCSDKLYSISHNRLNKCTGTPKIKKLTLSGSKIPKKKTNEDLISIECRQKSNTSSISDNLKASKSQIRNYKSLSNPQKREVICEVSSTVTKGSSSDSDSDSEPTFTRRELPLRYTRGTRYFNLLDIVKSGGNLSINNSDNMFYGLKIWEESESDYDWDPELIYGTNAKKILKRQDSESASSSGQEEFDESLYLSDHDSEQLEIETLSRYSSNSIQSKIKLDLKQPTPYTKSHKRSSKK